MNSRPIKRAEVFQALAQGLEVSQIVAKFKLTRDDLSTIFQEAANYYQQQDAAEWVLYCDGAARGNPGPAGAGAILYDPHGRVRAEISEYLGRTTNNVAEYKALILGLNQAQALGATRLRVFLDSQLVVFQLNGRYRVREAHLVPLWQEAKKALQKFGSCAISHVSREANLEADRLARQAIDHRAVGQ